MRGISFEVNDARDFWLCLDRLTDVSAYDWYVDDVDLNYYDYPQGRYSGGSFRRSLDALAALSFVRIRRYASGAKIDEIDTYEEFLQSNCDMLILFYDGGFCEVYAKDRDLIAGAAELCDKYNFEHVRYIENRDDERTDMHF